MEVELNGRELLVSPDGEIWIKNKKGIYTLCPNVDNCNGYNKIFCRNRRYRRHRIVAWVYLGLDIHDMKQLIDHKDGDRLNNNMDNLRIVNATQNNMNRKGVKGYYLRPSGRWIARLAVYKHHYNLGTYDNMEDARLAYMTAKLILHIIDNKSIDDINKYLIYNNEDFSN